MGTAHIRGPWTTPQRPHDQPEVGFAGECLGPRPREGGRGPWMQSHATVGVAKCHIITHRWPATLTLRTKYLETPVRRWNDIIILRITQIRWVTLPAHCPQTASLVMEHRPSDRPLARRSIILRVQFAVGPVLELFAIWMFCLKQILYTVQVGNNL